MKTEIKTQIRNWATTAFGILIWVGAIVLFLFDKAGKVEMGVFEFILLGLFGWVFVMAKNSLIEQITLRMFKVEDKK